MLFDGCFFVFQTGVGEFVVMGWLQVVSSQSYRNII